MARTKLEAVQWQTIIGWLLLVWLALLLVTHATAQSKTPAPAKFAGSAIVRNPADLPAPVGARSPQVVRVLLTAQEVVEPLDPATGVSYHYWTFNGKVPGPMIRVRVGDTVEVTLYNNPDNHLAHSLDFHAALGPGGGMGLSEAPPEPPGSMSWGRKFSFVATTPGLFIYHCGSPVVAEHIANGMYGLILVEPAGGLPRVDREYYVMQGEIYASGPGKRGDTLSLDQTRLLNEQPQYFVFNGALGALTQQYPLTALVGQTVRIFFGNAGPNFTSSPHMIGEIFTRYYSFGSLESPPLLGVQTGRVPPGSAAIFELKTRAPGQFVFVDHALSRVQKGLAGYMIVTGPDIAHLMYAGPDQIAGPVPPLAMTAQDAGDAFLADVSTKPPPTAAVVAVSFVGATAARVTMTDMAFVPAVIEIRAGQAVTWQNTSGTLHTVVDDANVALNRADIALPAGAAAFASPFLRSGETYARAFPEPGVYRYVCTQHERNGMIGMVIVKPTVLVAHTAKNQP